MSEVQEFPEVPEQPGWGCGVTPEDVQWDALLEEALQRGKAVPEVTWFKPGEEAAWHVRTCPPPSAGLPHRRLRLDLALARAAADHLPARLIAAWSKCGIAVTKPLNRSYIERAKCASEATGGICPISACV